MKVWSNPCSILADFRRAASKSAAVMNDPRQTEEAGMESMNNWVCLAEHASKKAPNGNRETKGQTDGWTACQNAIDIKSHTRWGAGAVGCRSNASKGERVEPGCRCCLSAYRMISLSLLNIAMMPITYWNVMMLITIAKIASRSPQITCREACWRTLIYLTLTLTQHLRQICQLSSVRL